MMSKAWLLSLLAIAVVGNTGTAAHIEAPLCPLEVENYPLAPGLTLSQRVTSNGAVISLVYEGQGWMGAGFSATGQMVGSTVVIGLPDQDHIPGINPGRYYLEDKSIGAARPLVGGATTIQGVQQTTTTRQEANVSSFVPSTTWGPSMVPTQTNEPTFVVTTVPPSPQPSDMPITLSPSRSPEVVPVPVVPSPPKPTAGPTFWWEWRRQLRLLEADEDTASQSSSSIHDPHHRATTMRKTLAISSASIAQNETHTVLEFVRPLELEDGVTTKTAQPLLRLLPPEEADFTMFLYAVGDTNTLGYHPIRGTLSITQDVLMVETTCQSTSSSMTTSSAMDHHVLALVFVALVTALALIP